MTEGRPTNTKPEDDYQTFEGLATYASKRARISASRNGHQEYLYWIEIRDWAYRSRGEDPAVKFELLSRLFDVTCRNSATDHLSRLRRQAQDYARLVHLRKMLVNRGVTVPRLSLAWLRNDAKEQL